MKFDITKLNTPTQNTWCPGCFNFMILASAKKAIAELIEEKSAKLEDFAVVTGIGCHGKLYDYMGTSGFYGLHGRAIPVANGITLGNPNMKVLTFAGDGDALAEGVSHFIHAARMNSNQALFLHNNKIYALTTGQFTPTTELGFKCKSAPEGTPFPPLNAVAVALESGATFVAREYAADTKHLISTMKAAIKHKGFAFVDILQPCLTFHNFTDYVKERTYRVEKPQSFENALKLAHEWDYSMDASKKIPVGVFYKKQRPTLDEVSHTKVWKSVSRRASTSLWNNFKV